MLSSHHIIEGVAMAYSVTKDEITGLGRQKNTAEARQVAAFLLREKSDLSYPHIGRLLGNRDHTTIMHACAKIKDELERDYDYRHKIHGIWESILIGDDRSMSEAVKRASDRQESERHASVEEIDGSKSQPLQDAMTGLDPKLRKRDRELLRDYRHGLTLDEIGRKTNVTRERARQIIQKAFLKELLQKKREGLDVNIEQYLSHEKKRHSELVYQRHLSTEKRQRVEEELQRLAQGQATLPAIINRYAINVNALQRQFPEYTDVIEKADAEHRSRWHRQYVSCIRCGTTSIPHIKKGLCERCAWTFKRRGGKSWRDKMIKSLGSKCSVCGMTRENSFRDYLRDLYLTKTTNEDGTPEILCQGCFRRFTGTKLGNRQRF